MSKIRDLDQRRAAWVRRQGEKWRGMPHMTRFLILIGFLALMYLLPIIEEKWGLPIISSSDISFSSVLFYPVAVYVMVAIGLNVVVGQAGLLDLGYVAFFAVGAYSVGVFGGGEGGTNSAGEPINVANLPWLACVPIGIALAMLAGVLLGTPTLRLRGDYLAIVTLGFGEIIRITANNTQWMGASRGLTGLPHPPDMLGMHFGVIDSKPYYWLALTVIIFILVLMRRLEGSRVGRAWTAIREDEDAAELMGVPTFKFKLWAFAIGAAVGGLSGTMFAGYSSSITPETFNILLSILFLAAVVLGGSGNLPGVILGAVLVAYLPERFRAFADKRVLVFGLALVVMMIFRPQGILPSRRRAIEMTEVQEQPDFPGVEGVDLSEAFDPLLAPQDEGHA